MPARKAVLTDVDSLVTLFDRYRIFYEMESDVVAAQEFLTARITNRESVIYLAEEAGRVVGFTQLYPLFSSTNMKRLWLLNDLYVEADYRGRGISKLLIAEAKQLCKATFARGLLLETAKSNAIGNRLYPASGFVLDTEHHYYFWKA